MNLAQLKYRLTERIICLVLSKGKWIGMQANSAPCLLFGKLFLSGFKYRDRTSIIGDILDSINSDPRGKAKTSIMRDANLSLKQVDTYLKHMMISGLIRATDPIESQEIARYRPTEKGFLMAKDAARWRHLIGHRPRTI